MRRILLPVLFIALSITGTNALVIKDDNTVLDCHGGDYPENVRVVGAKNVTIQNCNLKDGLNIVNQCWARETELLRQVQGTEGDLVPRVGNPFVAENRAVNDPRFSELWACSPSVLVVDTSVESTSHNTIFIGAFVCDVTLRRVRAQTGHVTALYLAGGSCNNRIEDNHFIGATHVDGSFDNVFVRNFFTSMVRLYKNCGEGGPGDPVVNENWRPVVTPSNNNSFYSNTFLGGVHIGARQSRNLEDQFCTDPSPYPDDVFEWRWRPADNIFGVEFAQLPMSEIYYLDYAKGNKLVRNFYGSGARVIIEDDCNVVRGDVHVEVVGGLREEWLDWSVEMGPC